MLYKVFPIELKPGCQAKAETMVRELAPIGPAQEPGTLSFRVYRDQNRPDYLLFVEHFAEQSRVRRTHRLGGVSATSCRRVRETRRRVRRAAPGTTRQPLADDAGAARGAGPATELRGG